MSILYTTYKIQKGDTLERISARLGITLFELRNFHNTHCELQDLLGSEIPKHLNAILIPLQENSPAVPQQSLKQDIRIELNNNSLTFNPGWGKQIIYEVSCTLQKGNKLNHLYYLIKVLSEKTKEGILLTLIRDQVYINGNEADLQAEELALNTIHTLYPIRIRTNSQGQFLGVNNPEEIRNQWKKKKQEEKYPLFLGETVEKYQQLVQETLADEKQLYRSLLHDLFIAVYLNSGMYTQYTNFETEQVRFFPIQDFCAPAEFTVTQNINPVLNSDNFIKVTQEGNCTDLRGKEDFETKGNFPLTYLEGGIPKPVEGYLKANYLLHPLTHAIESVELACEVGLDQPKKIQVNIYNLEKQKPYYRTLSQSFLLSEEEEDTGKGFFLDEK